MPISFRPIRSGKQWCGCDWSIDDDDKLAELVARIALGQHRHVRRILDETDCGMIPLAQNELMGARRLLTVPTGSDPFHRDGWLFQVIAWIAAHLQDRASLIAPPHMQHADKGFDGLHVHIDEKTQTVRSVVICEEKATQRPRETIRNEVWKEFAHLETGEQDNLLIARVSTLLETRSDLDADQAIQQIFWKKTRAFRIAITVGDRHDNEAGRKRLFKGYEEVVNGKVSRRRAETLHLDDLRRWMNRIARKAYQAAERMVESHV